MPATAERITFGGADLQPNRRGVDGMAMVFQNYALYPHMNVYGNIAFSLKLLKRPKAEIDERVWV